MLLLQFHAFAILGVVLLTLCVVVSYTRSRVTLRRLMIGIFAALFLAFVSLALGTVLEPEILPFRQCLVPSLCFGIVLAAIDRTRLTRDEFAVVGVLTFLIAFSGPFLTLQYVFLFEPGRYTGNPEFTRKLSFTWRRNYLRRTQEELRKVADKSGMSYPAGWLAESGILAQLPAEERASVKKESTVRSNDICPFWHSWFSNIYRVRHLREYAIWYPGGPLKTATPLLTWKEKHPGR